MFGDLPWFRIYQLYLYLCIHSQQFESAVNVLNRIFSHKKFKSLPSGRKERWYLLRAYLHWLIVTGIVAPKGEVLHSFRLGRFINEVPIFSKDKQGMNIPTLIIQALWLVQRKDYGGARERFTSLERYAGRYLRDTAGLKRAYYFIKLISQLPKADFHRMGFERKAARYLAKLQEYPRSQDQQAIEVEVIPYERFYSYILSILDHKLH